MSKINIRPLLSLLLFVFFSFHSLSAQDLRISYDLKPTNDPLKDTLRIYFQSGHAFERKISAVNMSFVYDGACSSIQNMITNEFNTAFGLALVGYFPAININVTYSGYVYDKRMQYGNASFGFGTTSYARVPSSTDPAGPRLMMQFDLLGPCNGEAYLENLAENSLNDIAFFDSTQMRIVPLTYIIIPIIILDASQFDFGLHQTTDHKAKLSWQVEGKWDFIELERSAYPDFRESYILAKENGSLGNSKISGEYIDLPPASQQIWYYRMKHVGLDGKTTYSQIESFKHNKLQARAWPSPIQDQLFVQVPEAADLRLLDINGRVLATSSTDDFSKAIFQTSNLSTGVYFLEINTLKNEQRQVMQLVK